MRRLGAVLMLLAGVNLCPAFDYNYNSGGFIEHWTFTNSVANGVPTNSLNPATQAVRFYISSDGWSTTNTAAELNAVRASFGQWQAIPGTIIKYEEAGFATPGYHINGSDNSNVVYWAKTSTLNQNDISGALGFTSTVFSVTSNIIKQFDIVLNGWQYSWFTDFNEVNNPGYFVESVLTHEIGHSLGLNHAAMGGATMLFAGGTGIDAGAGLSVDEIAYAHALYPAGNLLSTLGSLKGTVTKNSSPVLGAAVILEGTNGNLAGATVSLANGTYILNAVPPGNYNVRVVPLDPTNAMDALITGHDIAYPTFDNADTIFLPSSNSPVTLTAGATNTLNFSVTNATPAFRITFIRQPTTDAGSYSWSSSPATTQPGQSNYTIGVASADLPASGSFSITGDGLTLGAPIFEPDIFNNGLNFISIPISVSSNATPGLRTFIVTQGTNTAYANGFLEILPTIIDYNFDGLDDVFQRKYFSPFTSTNAAPGADPDGDGMNNIAEYLAGTNPTNSASLLKLTSITRASNGTTVAWQSVTNRHYQVMSRTNLVSGSWTNVGSLVSSGGTNAQFFDASATNGLHFYRVQVLP